MGAVARNCSHNFIDMVVDDFVVSVAAIAVAITTIIFATLTVLLFHLLSQRLLPIVTRILTYVVEQPQASQFKVMVGIAAWTLPNSNVKDSRSCIRHLVATILLQQDLVQLVKELEAD